MYGQKKPIRFYRLHFGEEFYFPTIYITNREEAYGLGFRVWNYRFVVLIRKRRYYVDEHNEADNEFVDN